MRIPANVSTVEATSDPPEMAYFASFASRSVFGPFLLRLRTLIVVSERNLEHLPACLAQNLSSDKTGDAMTSGSLEKTYGSSTTNLEAQELLKARPGGIISPNRHLKFECFGYFEDSNSNTMALLKKWGLSGDGNVVEALSDGPSASTSSVVKLVQERMPPPEVIDFLVQYFVSDLNWMKQVVHGPSFLTLYHQWRAKSDGLSATDLELLVLVLRMCSYAAQFLPSPSYTIDSVRGVALSEIRSTCSDLADGLAKECLTIGKRGSLIRVQHVILHALKLQCEGRTDKFWEGIAHASHAAQKAGIHTNSTSPGDYGDTMVEKEMRQRTLCVLYAIDSQLSRQLDRLPFLPDNLLSEISPQLNLESRLGGMGLDHEAPNIFTERLMQAQLGRFWRSLQLTWSSHVVSDPADAERRYEKFCAEFLSTLSPAFALQPDTKWDRHIPELAMQRQLLYIAIFDSICWNFRPLMMLDSSHTATFPPYKKVLHQSQKRRMAIAALKVLEAVSSLHSLFSGSYTRMSAIIFNTFEPTVLLLCLTLDDDFPFNQEDDSSDILGLRMDRLTRHETIQAAEKALHRLQKLAEVSEQASTGAQIIAQLLAKAANENKVLESPFPPNPTRRSQWSRTFLGPGVYDNPASWQSSNQPSEESSSMSRSNAEMMQEDLSYNGLQIDELLFPITDSDVHNI
ncbi:hypothetical protein JX265_000608 [Neoarthrinium moseri]|uniref:Xylanolytic transcriptional activator regulatory domain-containing protein n=1 Tax=Neoarthrinium moseri TaxID=1658444 RepID=A0A9P9WYV6_9PEZI|nr:hypothetical protein JX265_000608 [Neoarthrinium moseri]